MPHRRTICLAATALALAVGAAPATASTTSGCDSEYTYGGFQNVARAYGVAAKITPLAAPDVAKGHVAAWVGVGGPGLGPDHTTEWLQAGMISYPGEGTSRVYYEVTRPHDAAHMTYVKVGVSTGETHKLAVVERARHRSSWRVWLDGRPVTEPIYLPGSHGAWHPQAMTESWNAGTGACNAFSFRFQAVSVANRLGGFWRPMRRGYTWRDPGFVLDGRGARRFTALAVF